MPGAEDSITRIRLERERQKQAAREKLQALQTEKITLNRPVFFVPGWRDEDGTCWLETCKDTDEQPIRDWVPEVVTNPALAHYVTFTDAESRGCESFVDFGQLVKERVWEAIGRDTPFDAIGHSMGGLDIVAALLDEDEPLAHLHYLITVATPHRGTEWGGGCDNYRARSPAPGTPPSQGALPPPGSRPASHQTDQQTRGPRRRVDQRA